MKFKALSMCKYKKIFINFLFLFLRSFWYLFQSPLSCQTNSLSSVNKLKSIFIIFFTIFKFYLKCIINIVKIIVIKRFLLLMYFFKHTMRVCVVNYSNIGKKIYQTHLILSVVNNKIIDNNIFRVMINYRTSLSTP
jgi:hypothetical protein